MKDAAQKLPLGLLACTHGKADEPRRALLRTLEPHSSLRTSALSLCKEHTELVILHYRPGLKSKRCLAEGCQQQCYSKDASLDNSWAERLHRPWSGVWLAVSAADWYSAKKESTVSLAAGRQGPWMTTAGGTAA